MATYYTLLTKIGQARIANAVALNQMVNLTYMAVGDGNGNPTTPNENQTALVREKYRATINQLTVDPDNPNYLVAELIVPTTVGGWSIYEVGVFDDQNQLIAVANFPATYKPELVEGSGRDLIVRIVIQVSNTSVVTLKIDPAITLASQAWVAANYVKKVTVAGGTTGQILAKKSNANEDFQWVDPTAAVDVNVFSREETQTVATGQTIINLAQLTTDGAAIYIEGIRLRDDQFTVNSSTRLTLATSYPAGTKVTIVQNEETSRNAFTLKANNLSDLTDKAAARTNLGLNRFRQEGSYTEIQSANGQYRIIVNDVGDWGGWDGPANDWKPLGVGQGGTGVNNIEDLRRALLIHGVNNNDQTGPESYNSYSSPNGQYTFRVLNNGKAFVSRNPGGEIVPIGLEYGGTGATTADEALVNLGLKEAAKRDVGTGLNQIPDMSSFVASRESTGYQYLPGGLILQWGTVGPTQPGQTTMVTFPITFPTAIASINCTINATATAGAGFGCSATGVNRVTFGFTVTPNSNFNSNSGGYWICIGY